MANTLMLPDVVQTTAILLGIASFPLIALITHWQEKQAARVEELVEAITVSLVDGKRAMLYSYAYALSQAPADMLSRIDADVQALQGFWKLLAPHDKSQLRVAKDALVRALNNRSLAAEAAHVESSFQQLDA